MKRPAPVAARKPVWLISRVAGSWKVQIPFRSRYGGREPTVMSSVASRAGAIHLGMDTSEKTIMVATLMPGEQIPVTERIASEETAVRRFIARLRRRNPLREPLRGLQPYFLTPDPPSGGQATTIWNLITPQ
jgi:hypothetical protein